VDAAKDDRRVVDLGRLAGQLEAVAGDVGQFLDFAFLVVVGEDDGVLAGLEGFRKRSGPGTMIRSRNTSNRNRLRGAKGYRAGSEGGTIDSKSS
jgi:hypothetical protein